MVCLYLQFMLAEIKSRIFFWRGSFWKFKIKLGANFETLNFNCQNLNFNCQNLNFNLNILNCANPETSEISQNLVVTFLNLSKKISSFEIFINYSYLINKISKLSESSL